MSSEPPASSSALILSRALPQIATLGLIIERKKSHLHLKSVIILFFSALLYSFHKHSSVLSVISKKTRLVVFEFVCISQPVFVFSFFPIQKQSLLTVHLLQNKR